MRHRTSTMTGTRVGIFILVATPVFSQSLPTGSRLKDLAGSVWFGTRIGSGDAAIDKTIFLRECNAGQVAHYPAWGGWTAQYTYYLDPLNATVNYLRDNSKPIVMHMFVGPNLYLPDWFKNGIARTTKAPAAAHTQRAGGLSRWRGMLWCARVRRHPCATDSHFLGFLRKF